MVKKIDTGISHMFVDLDMPSSMVPPKSSHGIMKTESISGKKIFREDIFPDQVALSNILKRYYSPFHNTIKKIIATGEIKFIIECHTMMPVGPRNSFDAGKPRQTLLSGSCCV